MKVLLNRFSQILSTGHHLQSHWTLPLRGSWSVIRSLVLLSRNLLYALVNPCWADIVKQSFHSNYDTE